MIITRIWHVHRITITLNLSPSTSSLSSRFECLHTFLPHWHTLDAQLWTLNLIFSSARWQPERYERVKKSKKGSSEGGGQKCRTTQPDNLDKFSFVSSHFPFSWTLELKKNISSSFPSHQLFLLPEWEWLLDSCKFGEVRISVTISSILFPVCQPNSLCKFSEEITLNRRR